MKIRIASKQLNTLRIRWLACKNEIFLLSAYIESWLFSLTISIFLRNGVSLIIYSVFILLFNKFLFEINEIIINNALN